MAADLIHFGLAMTLCQVPFSDRLIYAVRHRPELASMDGAWAKCQG
jgi:hypothetical protein